MPKVVKNPNPGQVNPLFLGQTADHQNVEISDLSLIKNGLIIIGTKNSGKSSMIPNLFQQELIAPFEKDGKNYYPKTPASVIVITAKKDQSYILYAISRKRSIPAKAIHFLKPSSNYAVKNKLMGMKEYKYDAVNSIINFTDVIKNKETVLIDMETERYGEASVQAVGMLLMQLQIAMHNTAETGKRRCYLIIDDAAQYLPYLDNFLIYGSEYNLSTILVFSSRRQYDAYTSLVEDNLQNYLLMPNLNYDDASFFAQKYFLDSPRDLIGQGGRNCFLAAYDDSMTLYTSRIALEYLLYSDHQDDLMRESAKKYKQSLDQSGSDEEYIATIMKAYAYYTVQQHQKFKPGTATEAVAEMLESGRDKKITVEAAPTFINRFKPQQISASNVGPTVKAQDSVRGAGMQALLGAVHNSPDRIKEKLEKEGLTEETIKATLPSPQSKPNAGSAGGRPKEQPKQNNGKPNQNKPRQNTEEQNKPKTKTPENPYAAQLDAGNKIHEKDTGSNHPQQNKNHNGPGKNGNHNEAGKNGQGKGNNHKKGDNQNKKQQNQNQNKNQKHAETKPVRQNDVGQRTTRPNETKAQKPATQAAPKQESRKEDPQAQEKPAETAQNTVLKPEEQTTETLYELKPKEGTEQEAVTDSDDTMVATQADSTAPTAPVSPAEFVTNASGVNKESANSENDDAETDADTTDSDDSVQPGLQFDLSSTTDEEEEDSDSGEYTLDLHSYMADISDVPKSADAEFDAQTKKFLKILQNQTSRPSFFAQNKEIAEAEKRFGKH